MKYLIATCAAALLVGCGKNQPSDATPPGAPSSAAAPSPEAPSSAGASVQLRPTQGHTAGGMLSVTAEGSGIRLVGNLQGLPPNGEFGFHIHDKGDCSAPDASSAGDHFNPSNEPHGNPAGDTHHEGDMSNVTSDDAGVAKVDVQASGVTLQSGQPNDVLGRAVVLHEKADDYTTQPSGNSGARIACGVINP